MFTCRHTCCRDPHDESHQHLFEPSECLDCRMALAEVERKEQERGSRTRIR